MCVPSVAFRRSYPVRFLSFVRSCLTYTPSPTTERAASFCSLVFPAVIGDYIKQHP